MTTTKTRTIARRVAATAAAGAVLTGTTLLTAAPAHAGVYCLVVPHNAPVFEHENPESRVVTRIDAGVVLEAFRLSKWAMYAVSWENSFETLGYMKPAHLDCSITE